MVEINVDYLHAISSTVVFLVKEEKDAVQHAVDQQVVIVDQHWFLMTFVATLQLAVHAVVKEAAVTITYHPHPLLLQMNSLFTLYPLHQ